MEQFVMPLISIQHVSKIYPLYKKPRDRILEAFHPLRKSYHKDFYALDDVSITVNRGECVGLIGMNGSGKSTLLQIIAGVLLPTSGTVNIAGKISALLELGAGFNPEFSGIENVAFQCAMMGIPLDERDHVMNQVCHFAEIGDFVHQPVKTYSSGMFVRLAFATAVHVQPDILIVDEALAVGDIYFQTKCLDKIREFKKSGKTLLFVSHDASAVKALCDRAYLLHKGNVIDEGSPQEVFNHYNNLIADGHSGRLSTKEARRRSGNGKAQILGAKLKRPNGQYADTIISGERCTIEIELEVFQGIEDLAVGISLRDRLGYEVFGINNYCVNQKFPSADPGRYLVTYEVDMTLGANIYNIAVAVHAGDNHLVENYDWLNNALVFKVAADPSRKFVGSAYLPTSISFQSLRV